jgi:HNH endonuclease/AP2 domain
VTICVDRQHYLAHRLAWLYMTGAWPKDQLDHKNGVRNDNRWHNLRETTAQENAHNQDDNSKKANCYSKHIGVSWHKQRRRWRAYIKVSGKNRHIGLFDTEKAARAAYLKAKDELHPTHLRLRAAV